MTYHATTKALLSLRLARQPYDMAGKPSGPGYLVRYLAKNPASTTKVVPVM
jgi:hypothetical protein